MHAELLHERGGQQESHAFFANVPQVGPIQFYHDLAKWRGRGDFKGLVFR